MGPDGARLDVEAGDDGDVGEPFRFDVPRIGSLELISETGSVSGPLEVIAFARTQIFLGIWQ